MEKSRGLKKATNVGKARYGGPPNKEGDFQANRTLQIGLQDPSRFLMKIKGSKLHTTGFNQPKEDSSSALVAKWPAILG